MKVARTVLSGGKDGDNFKVLPIATNRKGKNMEPSIESIKAKCDEAVENAFTSNPLVMLEVDTIYWLIEKAQEKGE
ncbi:hypothetical protein LKM19_13120 [Bacillus cereus]|nr:hypothetical protein [Bacillus cereus]MCC2361700.1 hypothetical protein [Bacillus cereus]